MGILKVEKHISELLYCYDCVIIPSFGGFVANYKPAYIHEQKKTIYPPSKNIIFNKNLTTNDGLLATAIAQEQQLSYDGANRQINSFVRDCHHKLSEGLRIEIQEVGYLYYDRENNIQFQPDQAANFLQASFGLMPVKALPLVKEREVSEPVKKEQVTPQTKETETPLARKKEKQAEQREEPVKQRQEKTLRENIKDEQKKAAAIIKDLNPKKKSPIKYFLAAAVLIPFLFYAAWIPLKTDFLQTGSLHLSDLNPFEQEDCSTYTPRMVITEAVEDKEVTSLDEEIKSLPETQSYFALPLEEDFKVVVKVREEAFYAPESTHVEQPENTPVSKGNYHIVIGAFSYKENADGLVEELRSKGYSARILDKHKGLHRVTVNSYTSRGDAKNALSAIRKNENSSAWILKK